MFYLFRCGCFKSTLLALEWLPGVFPSHMILKSLPVFECYSTLFTFKRWQIFVSAMFCLFVNSEAIGRTECAFTGNTSE